MVGLLFSFYVCFCLFTVVIIFLSLHHLLRRRFPSLHPFCSLHSPSWPGTCCLAQASLRHILPCITGASHNPSSRWFPSRPCTRSSQLSFLFSSPPPLPTSCLFMWLLFSFVTANIWVSSQTEPVTTFPGRIHSSGRAPLPSASLYPILFLLSFVFFSSCMISEEKMILFLSFPSSASKHFPPWLLSWLFVFWYIFYFYSFINFLGVLGMYSVLLLGWRSEVNLQG